MNSVSNFPFCKERWIRRVLDIDIEFQAANAAAAVAQISGVAASAPKKRNAAKPKAASVNNIRVSNAAPVVSNSAHRANPVCMCIIYVLITVLITVYIYILVNASVAQASSDVFTTISIPGSSVPSAPAYYSVVCSRCGFKACNAAC